MLSDYTLKDSKGLDKIERMALRQRWDADPDKLNEAYQRQIEIASNPNTPNRESTAAFRAIAAVVGQNQKDEHKIVDVSLANQPDRLSAILGVADTLGIDPSVINPSAAAASDGDQSPDQSRL